MKKILITLISIIILIGTSVYFFIFQGKSGSNISYELTENISEIPTYTEQQATTERNNAHNAEIYNAAMRDQNATTCDGITDMKQKNECHDMIKVAIWKKDSDIGSCDTLSSIGVVSLCRDTISTERAVTTLERTICNHISDMDHRLYCKDQVDAAILRTHIQTHTVSRELCMKLGTKYQKDCQIEIRELDETVLYRDALVANDAKLCESIIALELKSTCRDTIILKVAITTENRTLCESIADTDKKLYCESQVSKTNDIAIYKSAITGTNIELCTPIMTQSLRMKCHDTIIISRVKNEQNTALCATLTNTGMISSCEQIIQ